MASSDRFNRFEYPNDDFPFYNAKPVAISTRGWIVILAGVILGFLTLTTPILPFNGHVAEFTSSILFFAIPLAALAYFAGKHWTAIFRKISGRDVLWMIGFALLNMVITMIIGSFILKYMGAAPNPALTSLAEMSAGDRILFILKTAPQLFGEEVLTILPFLAIMYWLYTKMNLSRNAAVMWAWILSAILFGLAHLPSYEWNLIQCLVVIGSARLILSLAYIKTKNIWVSTGAHIINDWSFFALTILGTGMGAG